MHASFLLLHGLENHRPPEHWQFGLAAKLIEAGHAVLYPDLPDSDTPEIGAWTEVLHEQLALMDPAVERVVICHSLACLTWFKVAAGITEAERPDRLLLVAPPANAQIPSTAATFTFSTFDPAPTLASVRGGAAGITIAQSDDDPYNPPGTHEDFAGPLGVEPVVFPGAGHINPDAGFGSWPWVLDWCLHR